VSYTSPSGKSRSKLAEAEFPTPDDWHICRDCIDPLGEFFEEVIEPWVYGYSPSGFEEHPDKGLYDVLKNFLQGATLRIAKKWRTLGLPSPGWR